MLAVAIVRVHRLSAAISFSVMIAVRDYDSSWLEYIHIVMILMSSDDISWGHNTTVLRGRLLN